MADEIRVAVASNFRPAMLSLQNAFEAGSDHRLVLIFGSTGKQYAQIIQGAPFDVFLAADRERPEKLEQEGFAVDGSRFTYALGRLVLWSARENFIDDQGLVLKLDHDGFLSMANPDLAPYGQAAKQTLVAMDLWESVQNRLVRGENVAQAYQFVATGNAALGFVALSQIQAKQRGSFWIVPAHFYEPITQQAVLLNDNEAGHSFMSFLATEKAREIIQIQGYSIP